ncbi:hypothetical protein ILUMI_13013 [Ignelater luminosus]|uniref:Pickpocket protein 28 n=1 Tax=Ignelater luminosus TaxID=2038154 RepID=A0A8K0CXH9_IGNLU|nr:hypothetical protein ILUMI_13013 [Ignelater luminosus]
MDIFNYTDILIKYIFDEEITDQEDENFQVFSLVCETSGGILDKYGIQERLNSTIDKRYLANLVTASPRKFPNFTPGYWQGKNDINDELLQERIGPDGLSYSFNMLDYSEIFNNYEYAILPYALKAGLKRNNWSPDGGYPKKVQLDTFPRRSFASGLNGGFGFLDFTFDNYTSCNPPLSGYKVVLHHPSELPNMDKQFRLPLDQAVFVAIKPRMITISENLKSYRPEARKCYLSNERKLRFFKTYTQENCEQECMLNKILTACRCVPFYIIAYNDAPVCGPKSKLCIKTVKEEYISNGANKCDCLPSCTSLEYDVEISQTDLSSSYWLNLQLKFMHKDLNLNFDTSNNNINQGKKLIAQKRETNMCDSKTSSKSKTNTTGATDLGESQYRTWKDNLSCYFSQYCSRTSIHGVQYIGEGGRLLIEKLVWIIVITSVSCACIYLITKTYNKWITSPVIVTLATTETPISEIPFPAVTICPDANADSKIFNFTDVLIKKAFYINTTDKEDRYFDVFSLFCEDHQITVDIYGIRGENLTTESENLRDIINASPRRFKRESFCTWHGLSDKPENLFSEIFTSYGLSYSFNMLNYAEIFNKFEPFDGYKLKDTSKTSGWSLDKGYAKENQHDVFPRRSFVPGILGGLQFMGEALDDDVKDSCNLRFAGFKVTVHHPYELPNMDKYFQLSLGKAIFIGIKPKMITVSEKLKTYKPEDRRCYLSDEKKLKFFKSYTQQNCEHECFLNNTLTFCKCIPFYAFGLGIPICGPQSLPCIKYIQVKHINNEDDDKCNCWASCTSLEYDIEISQSNFDAKRFLILHNKLAANNLSLVSNISRLHHSYLAVYYKELQFLASERNELYGYVDFFASIGGLLGLFIGFSVTSVLEIFYFATLRLRCNIKKYGKNFWSGAPELIGNEDAK